MKESGQNRGTNEGNNETKKYDVYLVIGPSFLGLLQTASQGLYLIPELGQLGDLPVALLGYCLVLFKELTR